MSKYDSCSKEIKSIILQGINESIKSLKAAQKKIAKTPESKELLGTIPHDITSAEKLALADEIERQIANKLFHRRDRVKLDEVDDAELIDEILKEIEQAELLAKTNAIQDTQKIAEDMTQLENSSNYANYVIGKVIGTYGPGKNKYGSKRAVDKMQEEEAGKRANRLMARLEHAGVRDFAMQVENNKFISQAGFSYLKDRNYKPGIAANEAAGFKTAKIYIEHWEANQAMAVKYGAAPKKAEDNFAEIFGYNRPDQTTILREDDFDTFYNNVSELFDFENERLVTSDGKIVSGDEPDLKMQYIREVHQTIKEGKNIIYNGQSVGFGDAGNTGFVTKLANVMTKAFRGKNNPAAKLSMPSQFKFKNFEAAETFRELYIKRDINQAILDGNKYSAHNTILLRELGTNPMNHMQQLVRHARKLIHKELDNKGISKKRREDLEGQLNELKTTGNESLPSALSRYMSEIDNTANQVRGSGTVAQVGRGIRILEAVRSLGMSWISAWSDLSYQTAALGNVFEEMPLGERFFRTLGNWFPKQKNREFMRAYGLGAIATNGAYFEKAGGAAGDIPGFMTQLQNTFFKFNIQNWHNDVSQIGTGATLLGKMGSWRKSSFKDLDPSVKQWLRDYNIDEGGWELLRTFGLNKIEDVDVIDSFKLDPKDPKQIALVKKIMAETDDQINDFNYSELANDINNRRSEIREKMDTIESEWWGQSRLVENPKTGRLENRPRKEYDIAHKRIEGLKKLLDRQVPEQDLITLENAKPKTYSEMRKLPLESGEDIIQLVKIIKQTKDRAVRDEAFAFKDILTPERYIERVQQNYSTAIFTTASDAIMLPGAFERSLSKIAGGAGTVPGELNRMLMQFKTFPITVLRRSLAPTSQRGVKPVIELIFMTTMIGMFSYQAKEYLKGRTTLPVDLSLVLKGFIQGGAAGLYGDVIMSAGQSKERFLSGLAGPGITSSYELVAAMIELTKEPFTDDAKALNKFARFARTHMPYQNLFYTKMALDYMIFNSLSELGNPGYLNRLERRIMRENEQEFRSIFGVTPGKDKLLGD